MRTGMAAQGAQQTASTVASSKGGAGASLKAALKSHQSGDHATAKKHALRAVNALHRMTQTAAPAPDASSSPAPIGAVAAD